MGVSAPVCRVCGHAYWGAVHVWDTPAKAIKPAPQPVVANKAVLTTTPVNTVVNIPDVVVNKPRSADRHADTDARRKYMAEYMAKRRRKTILD